MFVVVNFSGPAWKSSYVYTLSATLVVRGKSLSFRPRFAGSAVRTTAVCAEAAAGSVKRASAATSAAKRGILAPCARRSMLAHAAARRDADQYANGRALGRRLDLQRL